MSERKQQLRILAELIEATGQLTTEAIRMDSTRNFGRLHGEPQLAQYAVLAGLKLEDLSLSFGIDLASAIALEATAFGTAATVRDTDFKIVCSIHNHVSMIALQMDSQWQDPLELAGKLGRVFVELDRLSDKCGMHLRQTMIAGREITDQLFSEYRRPSC